jgi:hypothetical protein
MKTRRILLLGLPLLLAPLNLRARSEEQPLLSAAPRPGEAQVQGVLVTSTVEREADAVIVHVTARNPSRVAASSELRVQVMEHAELSPMARLVPPPKLVGTETMVVQLAPGGTVTRELRFVTRSGRGRLFATVLPAAGRAPARAAAWPQRGRLRASVARSRPPRAVRPMNAAPLPAE